MVDGSLQWNVFRTYTSFDALEKMMIFNFDDACAHKYQNHYFKNFLEYCPL